MVVPSANFEIGRENGDQPGRGVNRLVPKFAPTAYRGSKGENTSKEGRVTWKNLGLDVRVGSWPCKNGLEGRQS